MTQTGVWGEAESEAQDSQWSCLPPWLPETAFGITSRQPAGGSLYFLSLKAFEVSSCMSVFLLCLPQLEWVLVSWNPHFSLAEDTAMTTLERASSSGWRFPERRSGGPVRREEGAQEGSEG